MHRIGSIAPLIALSLALPTLAQVNLAFLPPEETVTAQATVKVRQTLSIANQNLDTEAETQIRSSRTGKRTENGSVRVQEKIEAVAVSAKLPGGLTATYDSEKPPTKNDNPQVEALVDIYRAMKGATYTTVYKDGRVVGVEGAEKILEAAPPNAAASLKSLLSPDVLMREAAQEIAVLPGKSVAKGDRWQRTEFMNLGGGQSLKFTAYYEYQGEEQREGRTLDKISVHLGEVKYALEPNAPVPIQVVNSNLKVEASTGTLFFDRMKGRVVERTGTTRIAGPMTFSLNGTELPGKLDLTIDQRITRK